MPPQKKSNLQSKRSAKKPTPKRAAPAKKATPAKKASAPKKTPASKKKALARLEVSSSHLLTRDHGLPLSWLPALSNSRVLFLHISHSGATHHWLFHCPKCIDRALARVQ